MIDHPHLPDITKEEKKFISESSKNLIIHELCSMKSRKCYITYLTRENENVSLSCLKTVHVSFCLTCNLIFKCA